MMTDKKNLRTLLAVVVGNKANKTARVKIEYDRKHPLYGKYMRQFTQLQIHDERDVCRVGDKVSIRQCKPVSKQKAWELVEVVEKGENL